MWIPILTSAFLVGLGGSVGSMLRYSFALWFGKYSLIFPVGTLSANLCGSFIIGALSQLAAQSNAVSPQARLLLITGFCGGLTTLSSFIYETAHYLRTTQYFYAGLYFGLTVGGAFTTFYLGSLTLKLLFKSAGGLWN